jgi:hypothetical protein
MKQLTTRSSINSFYQEPDTRLGRKETRMKEKYNLKPNK